MIGRIIGLARREAPYAPMELLERGSIHLDTGLEHDFRGKRPAPPKEPKRQVTILAREAWEAACAELGRAVPWTARRANMLVEGIDLPRRTGDVMAIGDVRLQVMADVYPCSRMDEAAPGLQEALKPDWRGGVGCRVIRGGEVAVGDPIWIEEGPK